MPIKGPRKLYKIDEITIGGNKAGTTGRAIVVKMKEPIGNLLGLTAMANDDADLVGTFGGTGPNAGYKYIKRIGGYRHQSFILVASKEFKVTEQIRSLAGITGPVKKKFKSISIGFPKGVTVYQLVRWLADTDIGDDISHIITPRGVSFPMGTNDEEVNDDPPVLPPGTPQLPPG